MRGGVQCLTQNLFRGKENCFGLLGGSGGMLTRRIFKIKGPRLAKNAFPEISARKN